MIGELKKKWRHLHHSRRAIERKFFSRGVKQIEPIRTLMFFPYFSVIV